MTTGSVTPTAPTGPTCSTCMFRLATRCRRFPPVAAIGAPAIWPSTKEDDWCGEHPGRALIEINSEAEFAKGAAIQPPPTGKRRRQR